MQKKNKVAMFNKNKNKTTKKTSERKQKTLWA